MLTASAKDPNRKDALLRKAANPMAFGRTEIPRIRETIVMGKAGSVEDAKKFTEAVAAAEAQKVALKEARNAVIATKEQLVIAGSNLKTAESNDAKPATVEKLQGKVEEAQAAVEAAEQTMNDLIDA